MNDLVPATPEKNDAFTRILRFMTDADIVLNYQEDAILSRWVFIDVLLRQRKFREDDIIDQVKTKFTVSQYTARNDIYKAQALFEGARKVSKKYLFQHHAEEIALTIERYKFDKSLVHLLPKLFDSYTKALAALPDEINKTQSPPPIFIFNAAPGQAIGKPMSIKEARQKAIAKMQKKNDEDYIDHEDVSNDT